MPREAIESRASPLLLVHILGSDAGHATQVGMAEEIQEGTTGGSGHQGRARAIAVLLILAALVKLTLIAMPPDEISPGGLPDTEEWRRGMAAQEWVDGPLVPYLDYQQGHFQGGTLLTIGLDAVSYAVFGGSPLTMRLPNLLYDWATIAFLFLLVDRLFSRRAAWIAGLLACVPSPGYAMVGAIAWASHVEANAFAMGVLWLWSGYAFRPDRRLGGAFGVGVAAGLALWFHYGLALWLAVMLLVEALRDRKAWFRPDMGARLLGVVVGLLPWWIYNLTHDWQGLGVYGKSAAGHFQSSVGGVGEAFKELLTEYLPHSLFLPDLGGGGRAVEFALLSLAIIAWATVSFGALRALLRERQVRPELALALYPLLWTLIYVVGSFQGQPLKGVNGYRYMLPLHPVGWICLGVWLARWRPTLATPAVGLMLLLFGASTASYLRPERAYLNATAPGHVVESVGGFLFERAGDDPERLVEAMARALELRSGLEADIVLFTLSGRLKYGSTMKPPAEWPAGPDRARFEAKVRGFSESLLALEKAAPDRFKPYFSPLKQGERPFAWSDRSRFWIQWQTRGAKRPKDAYAY